MIELLVAVFVLASLAVVLSSPVIIVGGAVYVVFLILNRILQTVHEVTHDDD